MIDCFGLKEEKFLKFHDLQVHFWLVITNKVTVLLQYRESLTPGIQCDSMYCYCVNRTSGKPYVETRVFASRRDSLDCGT